MQFFTSDSHLGHGRAISFGDRPFKDLDDMHAALLANWNSVVTDDDVVWHLGDVAWNAQAWELVRQLKGNIRLVPGNHDKTHPIHPRQTRDPELRRMASLGIRMMPWLTETELPNAQPVILCHMPPIEYELDYPRYPEWRPSRLYAPLIHGHVHAKWKNIFHRRGFHLMNVSVEVRDYAPVSAETLMMELKVLDKGGI